ncbi:MAG: cellulase family glycosylhydrolase [Verrucomicrobiota bacterium]
MTHLQNLFMVLVAASSLAAAPDAQPQWLPASPEKLPRWRGFNLLEKFQLGSGRKPFVEEDFKLISQWGFNFVRLPMDYRLWIKNGNWEEFDEPTLKEIDQAVAWGGQYGVHVCLNFHRAPGYTVAKPAEKTSVWTDPETQRVCALHWGTFAKRYKGIPSERLSFNLMNEPAGVDAKTYAEVVRLLATAIHKEDPNRLVIADGLQWGTVASPELKGAGVAEATRGYTPMEISHYKASWTGGERYPVPVWPRPLSASGCLLSPAKPEGSHPMVIEGPFAEATTLRLHVKVVSSAANLRVTADDKIVLEKQFKCGPGKGEWKTAILHPKYNVYQNMYDRDYETVVPAGTKQVQIQVTSGDWLEISELGFKPASSPREDLLPLDLAFGKKPEPFRYAPQANGPAFLNMKYQDRQWLWDNCIVPWKELENKGVGVIVGEWGAYNKTPHDVFLRWAEDCLQNWQQAGWGWSLWNFRGSFGVLDSERTDVQYEIVGDHKVDRKFLDLLRKY